MAKVMQRPHLPPDPHQGGHRLVAIGGPFRGRSIPLRGERVLVGRHPLADIVVDDITVSLRHAEIRRVEDTVTVTDLGSLNGTYVNGRRKTAAELRPGDLLWVGRASFIFLCAPHDEVTGR